MFQLGVRKLFCVATLVFDSCQLNDEETRGINSKRGGTHTGTHRTVTFVYLNTLERNGERIFITSDSLCVTFPNKM